MLWSAFENFELVTLDKPAQCYGCLLPISAGSKVFKFKQDVQPGGKKLTRLIVHDRRCWETWENAHWQSKAGKREKLIAGQTGGRPQDKYKAKAGYPVKGKSFDRQLSKHRY